MPTAAPGEVSSWLKARVSPDSPEAPCAISPWAYLHQAEVQDLHLSARGKKQIRRLDVAVHDPLGVRRFEGVGNLNGQRQQLVHFHGLPAHPLRQGLPLEQLHDDEVPAFVLLNRVDGADVGVIEGGSGARFALEALQQLAVLSHLGRKKLQGHAATELGVLGFVHHAHATRAQFAENLVVQQGLADQGILVHIGRLMVCGGGSAVKEAGWPPLIHLRSRLSDSCLLNRYFTGDRFLVQETV